MAQTDPGSVELLNTDNCPYEVEVVKHHADSRTTVLTSFILRSGDRVVMRKLEPAKGPGGFYV